MFVDYYLVLNIDINATDIDIKNAYKKQASIWHPDKNIGVDTTVKMQVINEAYLILKDKEARERFNIEYEKYKSFVSTNDITVDESVNFTATTYVVEDELLYKWMQNAKRQAVDLAKQAIKDFKEIGLNASKEAAKSAGSQLLFQIIISIFAVILFSVFGLCK